MAIAARVLVFLCLCAVVRADEPLPAGAALDSLGVVTHLDLRRSPYSDLSRVSEALRFVGVRNLRDMTPRRVRDPYETLAAQGFRFDFVVRSEAVGELPVTVTELEGFVRRHPGAIVSLEGLNEIKLWPANYHGLTGFAAGVAVQCDLYAMAKRSELLRPIPVLALTLGGASIADHERLGDISQCADLGNAHVYFGARPPWDLWDFAIDLARRSTSRLARSAVTETGYSSIATPQGVSEDAQARYLLMLVLEAWRRRTPAVYVYQLVDDRFDPRDWSRSLGLYRNDWSPRPAAQALHVVTTTLVAPGDGTKAVTCNAALEATPAGVRALPLLRDDGACVLALWREVTIWDAQARRDIAIAPIDLRVRSGAPQAWLTDPIGGEHRQLRPAGGVYSLALGDRPLLLELPSHSTYPRSREK